MGKLVVAVVVVALAGCSNAKKDDAADPATCVPEGDTREAFSNSCDAGEWCVPGDSRNCERIRGSCGPDQGTIAAGGACGTGVGACAAGLICLSFGTGPVCVVLC